MDHPLLPAICKDMAWSLEQARVAPTNDYKRRDAIDEPARKMTQSCQPTKPSKPNRLHRPSPDQSKSKLKRCLHQLAHFATDLLQQSRADFRVLLDLIHKGLHISSGQTVASDPRINLGAKRVQQSLLIGAEGLGTGMCDVHGAWRTLFPRTMTTRSRVDHRR